jgi:cytochrome P450
MRDEELVSQMRTIISAGYETVSAIVAVRSWLFYLLRHSFMLFSGCYTK